MLHLRKFMLHFAYMLLIMFFNFALAIDKEIDKPFAFTG